MEATTFKTHRLLLLLLVAAVGATLVAWQQKQKSPGIAHVNPTTADTVPAKKSLKVRNLDEAIDNLDHVNIDIDLSDLNAELAKIGPTVQKELANASVEVAKALKNIDMPKIKAEVDASVATIDWPKIKVDIDASLANVDWDKLKIELEKVQQIDLDKINIDLKDLDRQLAKIKPSLEKNLRNAKVEIEKAKVELKQYKEFVDGLEHDGLLDKTKPYAIIHRHGELMINGEKQPEGVYNKYKNFLEKHKTLTIEKSADDFNIDNDN